MARAKSLRVGPVEVRGPLALLSLQRSGLLATVTDDAGLVGAGVLRQFNVTFDYSRKQLIFEQNRNYGRPDAYDRAGMWLSQGVGGFEVTDVVEGGPAWEAGVRAGDKLLRVAGRAAGRLSLPALRERLKSLPPGRRVRLVVQSVDGPREVVLTLRELV